MSETAPESRTANSSSVRHGGPSDGGRTPQDGAARAGHGGAPTDRADGPFTPETMRERAARPDTVTGRDRDGNDFALRLREGSTALFDASGELRHVVLPDGVSFERGFDGLWGPPRRGTGEVISRKTDSETELILHDGSIVVLGKENERITDTAADKVLMYRQIKDGNGAWLRQPKIFLPHEEGGWVERAGLDTATYEGFLASANKAHEAAQKLFDIGARSAHGVPEHERLDRVGEERLKELYWRGSQDDKIAALYEWVRRSRQGVSLRYTQLDAVIGLGRGEMVNMAAGEGKSWVFFVNAALQAAKDGVSASYLITPRDVLANREILNFKEMLGDWAHVHRMNSDTLPPPPG
ncbi:hypothetical protein, partial [Streptomyces sp. NPDC052036]|uniref:hypothetical protein n=1 Tax=Streptomyces sp. NPDC052036 TaxID=3155171 RepID=UPI003430F01F